MTAMISLVGSLALAAAPLPEDSITLVPAQSVLTLPGGEVRVVTTKSFLLPEQMYDSARLQARQLQFCKPALDSLTEQVFAVTEKASAALTQCMESFNQEDELSLQLQQDLLAAQARALTAETLLAEEKKKRWVAWAVTGGVLFGGTTATILALGL